MEAFFVAGCAEDPDFAEAELLGDYLTKSFPRIGFTKDMRQACEWPEFRRKLNRLHGFACPGLSAVVWRRDGRLVGGTADFRRVLKDIYNLELEFDTDLITAITAENTEQAMKVRENDKWTPYIGKARKEWQDGTQFEGMWKDHQPVRGVVTFKDGSTYEGPLKDGKFHGHGKRQFTNGAKFAGSFAEGRRDGSGRYQDAEGNIYDGIYSSRPQLMQEKPERVMPGVSRQRPKTPCHGKGTRTWGSGRQYIGQWVNNEATGRGTETIPVRVPVAVRKPSLEDDEAQAEQPEEPTEFADGKRVYHGEFLNGRYHGDGLMEYENGDAYEGKWKDGHRHGPGIFTWAGTALTYDGIFDNDVPKYGMLRFPGELTCAFPGEVQLSIDELTTWRDSLLDAAVGEDAGWLSLAQDREAKADFYDDYPIHEAHDSAMATVLDRTMWNNLHRRFTAGGITLHSCIAPGLDPKNTAHPLGLRASDPDCYIVFRELFDAILRAEYEGYDPLASEQPTDLTDAESWKKISSFSTPVLEMAASWKLQFDRNVGSLPCAKVIDVDDRRRIEGLVVGALLRMKDTDHSLQGEYYPLEGSDSYSEKMGGMTATDVEALRAAGALFQESDCLDTRDWPDGRGVFMTSDKKLVVHVNKEDHISFFCQGTPEAPMDFQAMYQILGKALALVEAAMDEDQQQTYAREKSIGYLFSSLAKVGTGMTAEILANLPKLAKRNSIEFMGDRTGLIIANSGDGKTTLSGTAPSTQFQLSVPRALGTNETTVLNALIEGAQTLAKHEKSLAGGRKKMWLLEERPKILLVGAKEALADDSTHATRLAADFDLQLITPAEAVQLEIDKESKLGKKARWYRDAGKPVPREVVRESILDMLKTCEAHHVRFAGG